MPNSQSKRNCVSEMKDSGSRGKIFRSIFGLWILLSSVTGAQAQTFTSFDAGFYTFGGSINPSGEIAGSYWDPGFVRLHGFIRSVGGTVISFDPPNAVFTVAMSINQAGEITGDYRDEAGVAHGYVRDAQGVITSFDIPGAVLISPVSINARGEITGDYVDAEGVPHNFVRSARG